MTPIQATLNLVRQFANVPPRCFLQDLANGAVTLVYLQAKWSHWQNGPVRYASHKKIRWLRYNCDAKGDGNVNTKQYQIAVVTHEMPLANEKMTLQFYGDYAVSPPRLRKKTTI